MDSGLVNLENLFRYCGFMLCLSRCLAKKPQGGSHVRDAVQAACPLNCTCRCADRQGRLPKGAVVTDQRE